jgi:hypothetical protein
MIVHGLPLAGAPYYNMYKDAAMQVRSIVPIVVLCNAGLKRPLSSLRRPALCIPNMERNAKR